MEVASTSKTLVNFYQTTQHNNPEDSQLHIHHHENLKSHDKQIILFAFVDIEESQYLQSNTTL
jgi:hypothetical protein